MEPLTLAGITYLGGSFLSWGLGKFYDQGLLISNAELKKRLLSGELPPNNDIERAILTAHYKALKFIMEKAFTQEGNNSLNSQSSAYGYMRGSNGFKQIFERIDSGEFSGLISNLNEDWQSISSIHLDQTQELTSQYKTIPTDYILRAKSDLLSLAAWTSTEKNALSKIAEDAEFGWVPSFSSCLREQIKINDDFRNIFFATNQQHQMESLARIEAQLKTHLAPNRGLAKAMSGVEASFERIEGKVDSIAEDVSQFSSQLKKFFDKNDLSVSEREKLNQQISDLKIDRALSEERIFRVLKIALPHLTIEKGKVRDNLSDLLDLVLKDQREYVRKANIPTNDPNELQQLRKNVAAFLSDFEVEKARQALKNSRAKNKEKMEESARLAASYLIEEAKIEVVDLNIDEAISLYEEAAQTIQRYDKHQAIDWLHEAGIFASERGELFGRKLSEKAVEIYLSAIEMCLDNNKQLIPEYKNQWGAIQNSLGKSYTDIGAKNNPVGFIKAIAAYQECLTVVTKEAAPFNWASTQRNLGDVFSRLGHRGESMAFKKAVTAYESALTVHTEDAAPFEWAMIQNQLGSVFKIMGERSDFKLLEKAVASYEASLKICTKENWPIERATIQHNLGSAYQIMEKPHNVKLLYKAVELFEAALEIRTKEFAPTKWAMTQLALGNVYLELHNRNVSGAIDQSKAAYEAALEINTIDEFPVSWATITKNMGDIYWSKGNRKKSEQCYIQALEEMKRQGANWFIEALEKLMKECGF